MCQESHSSSVGEAGLQLALWGSQAHDPFEFIAPTAILQTKKNTS